jgi:YjbE family integral membrane protein|tara:strand:- start:115 stop:738 length:624 start_codon:yes stop_codon:yes gene_type:complete
MFADFFETKELLILTQIIFIDLVLAGDNAIIIGMVASKFPADQRKKIIFWGIGGAVILRIILTLLTAVLLQINGLRLIGGLLLLYIVYKLYVDVIKNSSNKQDNIKVDKSGLIKAIWTVLIADFTMSLDNVLGVAGAAADHYVLLIFGLVLSIVLMATAANLISKWIQEYKWIAWIGLLAILIVAIQLILTDNTFNIFNILKSYFNV